MTIARDLDLTPAQEHAALLQSRFPARLLAVEASYRLDAPAPGGDALRAGLLALLERHEVLRLVLRAPQGAELEPLLLAAEDALWMEELVDPGDAELEACLARARTPHPETSSTLRAVREEREGVVDLHLVLPAVNGDLATLDLLAAELRARLRGDTPAETLPHAAVIEPLVRALEHPHHRTLLETWQRHLLAAPRAAEFPFGPREPSNREFAPTSLALELDRSIAARLVPGAAQDDPTLFDALLVGWRLVLWRMSGGADQVLGLVETVRAGETARTLGPLTSRVPVHFPVDPEESFEDLVRRARSARLETTSTQALFSWEFPGIEREAEVTDELFAAQLEDRTGVGGDASDRLDASEPFDLRLVLDAGRPEPRLTLEFDASRVTRAEALRVLGRLRTLLTAAAASPTSPVRELPILSELERAELLRFGDGGPCPEPPHSSVTAALEAHASARPSAPALHFQEDTLSYGELNARANRIARHLRAHGVGPNVFVGLLFRPSFDMLAAIFGVLKAGGAYVPLDPEYPEERLRFLIEDAGARVLVRGADTDPSADASAEHVLVLGGDGADLPDDATDLEPLHGPTDLAYMIYTSGSTGRPKGVRVNHENLRLSTHARTLVYGGPPERFLLLSSFAFDSSVAGIFWTLTTGGALVLPVAGSQRDPVLVDRLIARWRVTHTLCLASHWSVLLSRGTEESFASIDTSVVSGEVFSTALIEEHARLTGGARLFNEYGPTEDTVWSTVFDCATPFQGNRVPIGRAIPGTRVYVLDEALEPVPIGTPGELYLGGAGVAQGYHERPDRTAQAFVPDPFRPGSGERLYRSGDRVRMLESGDLEFLGRFDDQVKLRGYRIELGEIEAVLGQVSALREVAVVCRSTEAGDMQLVAYYSLRPGADVAARDLRELLTERLPEYMVPAAFVELPELPRTPIGKLDGALLPAPSTGRDDLHEAYLAPRDAVESVLAAVFEDVLERDAVGVRDDFFELGGHSILAGRIAYHVRDLLGEELALRVLFESPTIEGLARVLREGSSDPSRLEAAAELALAALEDSTS